MADPGTIALIVALAGTGVAVAGTIQSGRAQAKMAEYNAQVAKREAQVAEQNAAYEEAMHRKEGARLMATQRARYAKSGVTSSGSPLLVMEDTAAEIERDALAIRYGGNVAAANARSSATLSRLTGSQAKTASYYSAGSSLLTGISKAAQYKSSSTKKDEN